MLKPNAFFFGLLLAPTLEQRGADKWNLANNHSPYLKVIFSNFQSNPFSHFASYSVHIYRHTHMYTKHIYYIYV